MAFYPAGGLFTTLAGGTIPGNFTINPGNLAVSGNITTTLGTTTTQGIDVNLAGTGLRVAEGANAKQGTATLTAGTVTVANTAVTANSRIFLTGQVLGGTAGGLNVTSRTAGTSFVVTSTNAADTSTFAYEIFEPG